MALRHLHFSLKTDFRAKGTLMQPWIDFFQLEKKVKVHLELFKYLGSTP